MARKVKLDHAGIRALLQSTAMHRVVQEAAEAVAENVKSQNIKVGDKDGGPREVELPVGVFMTTSDRAHGIVALAHPSGQAVQAKHGSLSKAAAQAGLEVNAILYYTTKSGKVRRATQAQIDNWTRG